MAAPSNSSNSPLSRRRVIVSLAGGIAAAWQARSAFAQDWPTRDVKFVVPSAAGGGPDLLARLLGERLGKATGQAFVVENRTGANMIVGSDFVAKSPPDGYTLLLVDRMTMAVNPLLYSKLPYSAKDFVGVSEVAQVNLLLVVRADSPYKTWDDMVQYARKNPGRFTVGTAGVGSVQHLSVELIKRHVGAELVAIPYRGVAPGTVALLAGEIESLITGPIPVLANIRAGRLRALAIGADVRSPLLPDVPTLKELGAPTDLLLTTHFTLHAPAKTPAATVDRIHDMVHTVLVDPEFVKQFQVRGLVVAPSAPREVDDAIAIDTQRLGKLIHDAGMKLD